MANCRTSHMAQTKAGTHPLCQEKVNKEKSQL